jgi:fumarate reductase (CoM/CoB) subunit A
MATGGGGRLYSRNNNTSEMTGDSYSLALGAGAILKDMEFVQFYPTMLSKPVKIPLSNSLFGDGAVLRNSEGERFMLRHAPQAGDMATRDKMSQAIFAEIAAGQGIGNQVYLDCTRIPSKAIETKHQRLYTFLKKHGIDMLKTWMLVSPAAHFFMGGIKINSFCETSLEGLFAAGECAGGVHGANRLATNALTEAAVFGKIAGKNAAAYASKLSNIEKQPPKISWPQLHCGSESFLEIRDYLCNTMWEYASIIRSKQSLLNALKGIEQCRKNLDFTQCNSINDMIKYYEVHGMCVTAKAIVDAALLREESRGSHFRTDFPEENKNWRRSLETDMLNGDFKFSSV